ncbi:MAG: FtsX-like permease family protein [Bryobacterales bacterium]|nr:FtsX-like permease family protein [Bryobacterales bacterium]
MSGILLRIAWREARASSLKFLVVIFGVAAGVGALTGVRGFSSAFQTKLLKEARTLMAADIMVRQFAVATPEQEATLKSYTDRGAKLTQIIETVSMLSPADGGDPVLVSVKAVDPNAYPFYGEVKLDPAIPLREALTPETIAISDDLVVRLDLKQGGRVRLGTAEFRIAAIVRTEPDRMTGSLNVGPRVMITGQGLERTGLMQFGSRASHRFLMKLPAQGIDVAEMRKTLNYAFPEGLVADYRETHPAITRALDRSTTFLSLVSLIALIVGSLGVATAVYSHIQQKLDTIAILKCLGARSSQVIVIFTVQTVCLGLAGGLAGLLVGVGVQRAFPYLISRYFQFSDTVPWSPSFAVEGLTAGLLVTLLFTLPTLLSVRRIRPLLILRRDMAEVKAPWPKRVRASVPSIVAGTLLLGGLAGLAGWLAESPRVGAIFVAGLAVALLLLAGVAWLLLRGLRILIRRAPRTWPVALRQGAANLYRPGNHAASVLVALGIGVMFTLTIYLIQKSLLAEVMSAAPPGMPNVFMINVTDAEKPGIEELLRAQPNLQSPPRVSPLVAARLVAVGGSRLSDLKLIERRDPRRRFLRTQTVGWVDEMPREIVVRQGAWWPKDKPGMFLSADENTAQILKLHPGQTLLWEASGREFEVKLTSIHRNQQVGMGPNAEFLFSRDALKDLPVQWFAALRIPGTQVAHLQREVYQKFPTVTVINAAEVLSIVQEIVDQVALMVRFISFFAIAAGVIILASTVAGTRMRRMREAAVLKTLGAGRSRLTGIFSCEFLILGAVAGLMGGLLATAFSRILLLRLLDAHFRFDWLPNLVAVVLTAALAVATGWLASLRVLSQKPLEVLREE